MKYLYCFFLPVLTIATALTGTAQTVKKVLPTPQQLNWADAEIGVIIHFDMNIFAPETYHYGQKETLPPLSVFHPSRLNTDQWIAAAKAAGARYAILVAKHGTGFSLWPTKAHDYNISNTSWKNGRGDLVADFIRSCKKYGIRPGIYCSVNSNTYYGISGNPAKVPDSLRKAYNEMVLLQLRELWTHYGKLFEIWFDGGVLSSDRGGISDEIAALVKKYQPQAILFQGPVQCRNLIRWAGNERGEAPYPMWSRTDTVTSSNGIQEVKGLSGNPEGDIWCPAESDFPNRKKSAWEGGWFWRADNEDQVLPAEELVKKYYTSVGRNTNMLIGMAIDTSGQFPSGDSAVFAAFGKEIQSRFSSGIAQTHGSGRELILKLADHPVAVNHIVLMENIRGGENIRKYTVEAWIDGQWKPVCEGISVGHKRIQRFDGINTDKLRLKISDAAGKPDIRKFAAYYINGSSVN